MNLKVRKLHYNKLYEQYIYLHSINYILIFKFYRYDYLCIKPLHSNNINIIWGNSLFTFLVQND
jgi:hypothetical protein